MSWLVHTTGLGIAIAKAVAERPHHPSRPGSGMRMARGNSPGLRRSAMSAARETQAGSAALADRPCISNPIVSQTRCISTQPCLRIPVTLNRPSIFTPTKCCPGCICRMDCRSRITANDRRSDLSAGACCLGYQIPKASPIQDRRLKDPPVRRGRLISVFVHRTPSKVLCLMPRRIQVENPRLDDPCEDFLKVDCPLARYFTGSHHD